MSKKPCVMVILDQGLQMSPAVLHAAALAHKSNDRLVLALFEYDRVLSADRKFDLEAYVQGRRQKLANFAAPLNKANLQVETRYYWHSPLLVSMLLAVLAERPQMVFKDLHAEPVLRRLLFTTQDLDLLRQCPEPLMLVRPSSAGLPKHLLAAVDPLDEHDRPHELNGRILAMANRLAMQCDAKVDVVHVFESMSLAVSPEVHSGWVPDAVLQQKLRDIHSESLHKLCKEFGIPPDQVHLLDGEPGNAIAEFAANRHSEVVIMGTVQRGSFERLVMGSVAERLLDQLDCDVLALKPDGFRARLQVEMEHTNIGKKLSKVV